MSVAGTGADLSTTVSAGDAVRRAREEIGPNAFVIMSTVGRFEVGLLSGESIVVVRRGPGDEPTSVTVEPDTAYELRLFNVSTELIWCRQGTGGRLTLRSQSRVTEPDLKSDALKRGYLLWGQAMTSAIFDGAAWTEMRSPRVAPFWIPISVESGRTVRLAAIEHVVKGKDGNAYVAFERLTGFEVGEKDRAE